MVFNTVCCSLERAGTYETAGGVLTHRQPVSRRMVVDIDSPPDAEIRFAYLATA